MGRMAGYHLEEALAVEVPEGLEQSRISTPLHQW